VHERPRDVTPLTSPTVPVSVSTAAAAAEQRWVEAKAEGLTCLEEADREIVTAQLSSAGFRTGSDWTARFVAQVSSFALWSGLVFAAVIGAANWASRIPSLHAPAAITAAAYLVIVVVAFPVCRRQARPILDHFSRIPAEAPRYVLVYILILAGVAVLFSIASASAFNIAATRHVSWLYYLVEFAAFIVVTAVGFVIACLLLAFAYAYALPKPETNQGPSWVGTLDVTAVRAGTLAATAISAWFPALRQSPVPAGNPHLDSGLLRLLGCTVTIDRMGRGELPSDPRTVRSVILSLELAAADLEQYAVDRVPRSDTATRRLVRQDGARLASVIRNAKAPVARAVHPRNYTTVATTLAGFLLAWAHSEPSDFTAAIGGNASTQQMPLWRRVVGRIWNAVLLAAAGVCLPLLPIYNNNHAAAAGLRYALLTAAVLALAAQGSPASDIIESALENTLPGGTG
jgi:hypothetical protein